MYVLEVPVIYKHLYLDVKTSCATVPEHLGFKLIGDNIDQGVNARFMRAQYHQNQSLHYFHFFAVQNRIDHSHYPDVHSHTCFDSPRHRALALLPSQEDDNTLRSIIITLVSRILAEHMPFFKDTFEDVIEWHIKHKYYAEMSSKSVVVSVNQGSGHGNNHFIATIVCTGSIGSPSQE